MFPGNVNPKQLQQMMKAMGIKSETLNANRVTIELNGKKLVLEKPSVTVIEAQGKKTYTIAGEERLEELGASHEDVKLVMEKTGASKEKSEQALKESGGDIAQAILDLQS